MARVLFINVQYLKDNTPINENLDSEIVQPIIGRAQDRYILPIVGTALYNRLIQDVTGGTLTGVYKNLMDNFIQPCLKEFTFYEVIPFIGYRFTNKNVAKKDSDNSQPADLSEIDMLRNGVRDMGEFYAERMTRFLWANQSNFPEFVSPGTGMDTIPPVPSTYFSGIHIPRSNWGNCGTYGLGLDIPLY